MAPKTDAAKLAVRKNKLSHGVFAKTSATLITEDLNGYSQCLQSLTEEYAPETPTESLLVEQIAMGWQRLRRIWGVEAAIADVDIIQQTIELRYPDEARRVLDVSGAFSARNLAAEARVLQELTNRLTELAAEDDVEAAAVSGAVKRAASRYPKKAAAGSETYAALSAFVPSPGTAREQLEGIHAIAAERVLEIAETRDDQDNLAEALREARIRARTIPEDTDRIARYELSVIKSIYGAVDKIRELRELTEPTPMGGTESCRTINVKNQK